MINNITAVILAAGLSKRLGVSKQSLPFFGTTLLMNTYNIVSCCNFSQIIVIINEAATVSITESASVKVIVNHSPHLGQSESIKLGVKNSTPTNSLMYFVCDMPYLQTSTINTIINQHFITPAQIIQPTHNGVKGNPVLFPATFRDRLLTLSGDKGGMSLISIDDKVCYIETENFRQFQDVDTYDDYIMLQNRRIVVVREYDSINYDDICTYQSKGYNFLFITCANSELYKHDLRFQHVDNIFDIFSSFDKNLLPIIKSNEIEVLELLKNCITVDN